MNSGHFAMLLSILGGVLGLLLAIVGVKPVGFLAVYGLSLSMFLVGYLWGNS